MRELSYVPSALVFRVTRVAFSGESRHITENHTIPYQTNRVWGGARGGGPGTPRDGAGKRPRCDARAPRARVRRRRRARDGPALARLRAHAAVRALHARHIRLHAAAGRGRRRGRRSQRRCIINPLHRRRLAQRRCIISRHLLLCLRLNEMLLL